MALIGERTEAEIDRIHQEAAFAVSARRTALEDEVVQEQSRRDAELLSTEADISAFDAQLAEFQAQALEFLGRVTTVGRPPAVPTTPEPPLATPTATSVPVAMPVALEPGAPAAPTPGPIADDPPAVTTPPEPEYQAGPPAEPAPGPSPAFEAFEAFAAVEPEAIEPEAIEPEAEAEPAPDPDFEGTTVSVRGLADIASIAAFMRPLSRTHGIESVQIRSAQNGEVAFAVVHGPDVDVSAAIRATPHFDIEILEARPRNLTLRASERLSPPESRPAD
jgi:hypothetical protein